MDDLDEILRTPPKTSDGAGFGCRNRAPLRRAASVRHAGAAARMAEPPPKQRSSPIDPGEFLRQFLENERRIYAFIVSILPNLADAEDVLQETSIVLWQKFDQFRPGTDFVAWACRIAQFKVMKFYEKRARSRLKFDVQAIESIAKEVLAMGPLLDARHDALAKCLENLTTRDRDLLTRRYSDDATPQQIAEQVGRSIHAIYKALSRIHDALMHCIQRKVDSE